MVVFDLDGTLLDQNSYHIVVRRMLRSIRRLTTLLVGVQTLVLLGLRAVRILSRVQVKRRVQSLFSRAVMQDPTLATDVANAIRESLHGDVTEGLARAQRSGAFTVLSTAAFPESFQGATSALALSAIVATSVSGQPWVENIGVAKAERTISLLNAESPGWRRLVFVTDSDEDLPLARLSDVVLVVDNIRVGQRLLRSLPQSRPYTLGAVDELIRQDISMRGQSER